MADEINGVPCEKMFGAISRFRDIRKGFSGVTIDFDIDADCDEAQKDMLMAAGVKYSAVFDMLANPTEVTVRRNH